MSVCLCVLLNRHMRVRPLMRIIHTVLFKPATNPPFVTVHNSRCLYIQRLLIPFLYTNTYLYTLGFFFEKVRVLAYFPHPIHPHISTQRSQSVSGTHHHYYYYYHHRSTHHHWHWHYTILKIFIVSNRIYAYTHTHRYPYFEWRPFHCNNAYMYSEE